MRWILPLFAPLFALSVVAACAPSAPYAPPPSPPHLYGVGPAPVHAELRLCTGATAFNAGPIAYDRTLLNYRSYIETQAGPLLRNPTDFACLSSGYGLRGTASGGGSDHSGIDLANRSGGYIYAAGPGRVSSAGWKGSYGLMIEIDHGRGVYTRYGHLSEIDPRLAPGVPVTGGEAIARMGRTGNASGVHLHYELLIRGQHANPLLY
jgi:murein DD-endopeptidase MepM/ murein hydrolase activator NlpD